jgi:hypothetical protein
MPLVETVVTDRVKIKELARKRDGSLRAFALRIGRHAGSFTNMKHGKPVGIKFAEQIAAELGVELGAITVSGDEAAGEDEPLQKTG